MRKLGKKSVKLMETISGFAVAMAACNCFCTIGSNTRYSVKYNRERRP